MPMNKFEKPDLEGLSQESGASTLQEVERIRVWLACEARGH